MSEKHNHTRRRFLTATGIGAAAAIAGCTGDGGGETTTTTTTTTTTGGGTTTTGTTSDETETTTTEEPEGNDRVFQLINSTITTFDPVAATDTASGTVIQNVFDGLMNYPNGEAAPEQLLAADYEVSDDFTTYTFNIKEDATFHNGNQVRAQDFIYSFERLAQSSNSRRAYFILDSLGVTHETTTNDEGDEVYDPGTLGLTAVDDKTLEIKLSRPFHASLQMLAYSSFAAVPEGIVGDVEGYDGEMEYNQFATSNPMGAGPYTFGKWEQGTEAEVSRYDDYHGTVALNGGVHWQIIEDTNAAYNYGQNKNSDLAPIPSAQYSRDKISVERTDDKGRQYGTYGPMRNGATANYLSVPQIVTFYIGFNMLEVPKPVRQAFSYATNQQLLTQEVFKSRGEPAYHFTPPSIYPNGNYTSHAENSYPYGYNESDIESARQVMEEAGYGPNSRYQVQWTQYQSSTWEELAKIIRDQVASAYIDMSIEKAPFSTLIQRGRQGNLDVYTLGWIADWPSPDNFLQLLNPPQTDTTQSAPISYINWNRAAEEGMADAAQQATDAYETVTNNYAPTDEAQSARNEAYVQIEEANWEDVGFLNIYHELGERFAYDWVDIAPYGGMGPSRQMYNEVVIGERS